MSCKEELIRKINAHIQKEHKQKNVNFEEQLKDFINDVSEKCSENDFFRILLQTIIGSSVNSFWIQDINNRVLVLNKLSDVDSDTIYKYIQVEQ